ncbi:MAG: IS66 family transposase [Egibacteraceae bacterium]
MKTKSPRPSLEEIRKAAEGLLTSENPNAALDYLMSALSSVLQHNQQLEQLLAKLERAQVGRRSEKIDPRQLALLFEELCRQSAAQQESSPAAVPDAAAASATDGEINREIEDARKDERAVRKKGSKKKGSRVKVRNVHQVHHHQEVPEADRHCAGCGKPKRRIGEELTRILDYEPARFVENIYHREKLACGNCKDEVTTATGPNRVLVRSDAGPGLLAHLVVSKYADHCPLHRLHRIHHRVGVHLPVSTTSDWIAGVAQRVRPIVEHIAAGKGRAHVIGTDATGLRVLDPDAPTNIVRGTIWCYVLDGLDVVFRYAPRGDGQSGPWEFLAGRVGYVQADGSNVFDRLFNGEVASATESGCWSHARRPLEELKDVDCRTAWPLRLITRLFRIEELADLRHLEPDQRQAMRRDRSAPTLKSIEQWVDFIRQTEPPGSNLAKAANYLHNQWGALTRFLDDGRLRLENNQVEQQLRDVALGRKNFLFAGSHEAADRAAVLYSLMRTCALRKIPPQRYLADILQQLADGWPLEQIGELAPARWAELHRDELVNDEH